MYHMIRDKVYTTYFSNNRCLSIQFSTALQYTCALDMCPGVPKGQTVMLFRAQMLI